MISVSFWYQHKDVSDAKRNFNEVFENICEYFVNNELKIFSGGYKSKSVQFANKLRTRNLKI